MAEKKRWIAMYTKHIKQKRKVYHDGFLDLHLARNKVMLYDDAGNLLDSRMLKPSDVVSSGETLAFQAYLVDIGDPKEGGNPSSDPKIQVIKPEGANHLQCSGKISKEKKPNFANHFPVKSLSPSHKMIRVFKKRELHKLGPLSPDSVNPTKKGTLNLGSAGKGGNNRSLFNSPCAGRSGADSRLEDEKLRKDVPLHQPLRDVNQILSILQRPNVTETCSDNNLQTSMPSTKVPPESHTKMESVSSKAASKDPFRQQFTVQETSAVNGSSLTRQLNDSPSFDLGI